MRLFSQGHRISTLRSKDLSLPLEKISESSELRVFAEAITNPNHTILTFNDPVKVCF